MDHWREALNLAQFELRKSIVGLIIPLLFLIVFVFIMSSNINLHVEADAIIIDIFLIIFSFVPIWIRPSEIQFQKINENGLWASPIAMMQLTLPISKNTLIKSRLIIHLSYSLPIYLSLFLITYILLPPVQATMSFGVYIIFMFVWISFYLCLAQPTTDTGEHLGILKSIVTLSLLLIGLIGFLYLFHFGLEFGVVQGSILLVKKWPLLSAMAAILLSFSGLLFSHWYMNKRLNQIDYF